MLNDNVLIVRFYHRQSNSLNPLAYFRGSMQSFKINVSDNLHFFKLHKFLLITLSVNRLAGVLLLISVNIIAASDSLGSECQILTRAKSRQMNELLITGHDGLYMIIHDGSNLGTDRLVALKRLRGLKIEMLGITERIQGVYWFGGIGQAPQLSSFNTSLRVLDLSLSTTRKTFKLSSEGSTFLKSLVNLEELSLRNHYITTGAANLSTLVRLKKLDLYNNKIGRAIKDIKTLVNLAVLDLGNNSNMPISLLKETLLAMPKLREIDLSFLSGVIEKTVTEWFIPQVDDGSRAQLPIYEIVSDVCSIFEDQVYKIPFEGVISVNDFLKELYNRLTHRDYQPSEILPKSACVRPECLVTVLSSKGGAQARFQKVYDPDHVLMHAEIFTPSNHNHLATGISKKGTHKVGFYSLDGSIILCLKESPEAPGIERAARLLYENLFGIEDQGVPNSETILMNGKVFTVSTYVDGKTLEEIIGDLDTQKVEILHEPEQVPTIPVFIENLHKMKVFALLTAPEDGRAQNCICQTISPIGSPICYRLVSIDNERSFGNATPHSSRRNPEIIIRGHSVMYCFSENSPDYSDLTAVLYAKTPEEVCTRWLEQIREEDRYQWAIAPFAEIPDNSTRLGVPLTETIARGLLEKLRVICDGLRKGQTLEELFMVVNQPLAHVYSTSSTEEPMTPPAFPEKASGSNSPPISCIATAARKMKKIDGGRLSSHTPLSANCDLHGDYLPAQTITKDVEAVLWSQSDPSSLIDKWDDEWEQKRRKVEEEEETDD